MKQRLFAFILFFSVFTIATMGIFVGVSEQESMHTNSMSHCLFHMFGGTEGMKLNEHVNSWRNSVTGLISFSMFAIFLFYFVYINLFSLFLFDDKNTIVQYIQKRKKDPPKLFVFLNIFLARGIIHPKLFSL